MPSIFCENLGVGKLANWPSSKILHVHYEDFQYNDET